MEENKSCLFLLLPSKTMKMEYYISIDNEKRGPYNLNELAERNIQATTLVMPADGTEWLPAWQIEELRILMEGKAPSGNQTQTEEMPFVEATPIIEPEPQEQPAQQQPTKKKSYTGCLAGVLIAFIALAALLILTCPKPEQHKEKLAGVITATVNDAIHDSDNITGNELIDYAFKNISNAFAGKVIEAAVDNLVTVDNYVVCSLGKVHYHGKDHIVSLGLLGHIFTVDKDDLEEAAELYYKKSEINMKEQIRKKAYKMLQDNVIAPATSAIGGMLGGVLDGLLDGIGSGEVPSVSDNDNLMPADSI